MSKVLARYSAMNVMIILSLAMFATVAIGWTSATKPSDVLLELRVLKNTLDVRQKENVAEIHALNLRISDLLEANKGLKVSVKE